MLGAVIIWLLFFKDDPNLRKADRRRIKELTDSISYSNSRIEQLELRDKRWAAIGDSLIEIVNKKESELRQTRGAANRLKKELDQIEKTDFSNINDSTVVDILSNTEFKAEDL